MRTNREHYVLVTGGTGYIASHIVVELVEAGFACVLFDNLANSSLQVVDRIARITGQRVAFEQGDIRDKHVLSAIFEKYSITAVVHCAGLKAVAESVIQPLLYYENNVSGSLNLLQTMQHYGCYQIVFSSSATVYGEPENVPIIESAKLDSTNPYGHSKRMVEQVLFDLACGDARWRTVLLRYFNPVAAHPDGLIGEDPVGVPNNLMPCIAQVAVGRREKLTVHGNDYNTIDGTGVRDYIHVVDLAQAHLAALRYLPNNPGCRAINVGTGSGYSVLQMIEAFERASNQTITYEIGSRREGDVASCYANVDLARELLGWQAQYGLTEMMRDQWHWQQKNPSGFQADNKD